MARDRRAQVSKMRIRPRVSDASPTRAWAEELTPAWAEPPDAEETANAIALATGAEPLPADEVDITAAENSDDATVTEPSEAAT